MYIISLSITKYYAKRKEGRNTTVDIKFRVLCNVKWQLPTRLHGVTHLRTVVLIS
jgi:hypothetical protein